MSAACTTNDSSHSTLTPTKALIVLNIELNLNKLVIILIRQILPKDWPNSEREYRFNSKVNFFCETVGAGLKCDDECLQLRHEGENASRARGNHVIDMLVVGTPRVVQGQCTRDAMSGDQTRIGRIVPRLFGQHKHGGSRRRSQHELECHQH